MMRLSRMGRIFPPFGPLGDGRTVVLDHFQAAVGAVGRPLGEALERLLAISSRPRRATTRVTLSRVAAKAAVKQTRSGSHPGHGVGGVRHGRPHGVGGVRHRHPQGVGGRQQRPHFLAQAPRITRARRGAGSPKMSAVSRAAGSDGSKSPVRPPRWAAAARHPEQLNTHPCAGGSRTGILH